MSDPQPTSTFQLELVSPEKVLYSGHASMVTIPGIEGEFGVLVHHAPFVSSLHPGIVCITLPEGGQKKIFVSGGFSDVTGEFCTILAEEAVKLEDLNKPALEELEADLAAMAGDAMKSASLTAQIRRTREKLAAVS
jgi:F-type H+-transporting ATPase subunit epsilon